MDGQTDSQIGSQVSSQNAKSRTFQAYSVYLRPTSVDLRTNLSSTKVNASHRKWVSQQSASWTQVENLRWLTSPFGQGFKRGNWGGGGIDKIPHKFKTLDCCRKLSTEPKNSSQIKIHSEVRLKTRVRPPLRCSNVWFPDLVIEVNGGERNFNHSKPVSLQTLMYVRSSLAVILSENKTNYQFSQHNVNIFFLTCWES